jgi:phosphoribosylanthranilate isomerase
MVFNKIKICGMKFPQNINLISLLNPNLIGFIFYSYSPRFIGILFPIELSVKKVGVFVTNTIDNIIKKVQKYTIKFVQLHGDESIEFCEEIYKNNISIIKVFRIYEVLSISDIKKYTNYSIYFLFDTYSKQYGGSGKKFSWKKISKYTLYTKFFIGGGICTEDVENMKNIFHIKFLGIDLNSKFEIEPGTKNRYELRRFIHKISL